MIYRVLAAAALALVVTAPAPAQDAAKGEALFKKRCRSCHTLEEGKSRVGPSLAGIVGAPAAQAEKFKYSKALRESGIVWDEATLDAYLTNPRKFLKRGRMAFAGLRKAADRADIIAYLKAAAP